MHVHSDVYIFSYMTLSLTRLEALLGNDRPIILYILNT